MIRRHDGRQADILAVVILLMCAAVIGLPVLSGGYRTYMDNPNHLAEISALAAKGSTGWSDLAFCGFPLATLNSPLCYGALAAWSRVGLPASFLYGFLLWLACAAPAVAFYGVARRVLRPFLAAIPAYFVLVQRTAIVGEESSYGGMWTWYLAMAGVILLLGELCREDRPPRRTARVAALLAFVGLTHVFALVVAILVMTLHTLYLLIQHTRPWRLVLLDLGAGLLAAAASAAYWLPLWLSRDAMAAGGAQLPFPSLLLRLVVPTDIVLLHLRRPALERDLYLLDALPMLILVGLGLAGIARFRRLSRDRLPLIAAAVAVALLVLLAVDSHRHLQFLGTITWRYLYPTRIALALAGIAFLVWLSPRIPASLPRWLPVTLGFAGIAAGFFWGQPLSRSVARPDSQEVREVESLWSWLASNRNQFSGRLYLQDTFMTPPLGVLSRSHILSLTADETGVRQLGAWYGAMPLTTAIWTKGDFDAVFGLSGDPTRNSQTYGLFLNRLALSNTGAIVVSNPDLARALSGKPEFAPLYSQGRYTVLKYLNAPADWTIAVGRGVTAVASKYEPGRITLDARATASKGELGIREAWHPFWTLVSPPEIRVSRVPYGLILLEGIPAGQTRIVLKWAKPVIATWISLLGWGGIAAVFILHRTRRTP